ncbi:hypothetical protein L3X38_030523 [Prunus dulcis]|uniref:Uncharacterized protein n=1 Tax=Prunus dulcis TaxID=3755 RepID=A0AAD4VCK7_PRUDU|nr:hypothetical protein L3X38_030523 [Prunus dulcis]
MVALGQHCCGCLLQHVSRRGGLRLLREQLNRWSSGSQKTGGQNTMTAWQGDMPGSKRGSTRPGASQDIW